jgi:hypothetical protein
MPCSNGAVHDEFLAVPASGEIEEAAMLVVDGKPFSPLKKTEAEKAVRVGCVSAEHGAAEFHSFDLSGRDAEPSCTVQVGAPALALTAAAIAVAGPVRPKRDVQRISFAVFGVNGAKSVPIEQRSGAAANMKRPGIEGDGKDVDEDDRSR